MSNNSPASTSHAYDGSSIQVLKGLEAVRMRPAMYIGTTDKRGLHHLVSEILDNSVDEAMAGYCTHIQVTVQTDGETIVIEDNGRGIPVDMHPTEGKSALEVVLTTLHGGGKFNNDNYKGGSGGLHGVGASCVNALSDDLTAYVWRDGGEYMQKYQRGVPLTPVTRLGNSNKHGTAITFRADATMFSDGIMFDDDTLTRRLREVAFLSAGLKITYNNKRTNHSEVFHNQDGIRDYVKYLTAPKTEQYPSEPFSCEGSSNDVDVKVSFQFTAEDGEMILCFTNLIPNQEGGTHLSGFKTSLTRVVNQFARSLSLLKASDGNLSGDDVRDGISAVISVRLQQPQFESQTKIKLLSAEADGAVNTVFGEALTEYFQKNPAIVKMIVERALMSQRIREANMKQRDLIKKKSFLGKNHMPGKLKDCRSEDRSVRELFLVEGDSAAGSAEDGRDFEYQAVLALRGKIINAEKTDVTSLLKNNEIQSLITAIGAGIDLGSDTDDNRFKVDDRRYNKIIIMCDADIDGSHIATLILTFLYRFMRPLILGGHVYLACPPLYKMTVDKKVIYLWTEEEMRAAVAKTTGKSRISRFKGLGEMGFDELGETTMNRANRRLIQVTVPDLGDADHMLSVLMGRNITLRKAHIVKRSVDVAATADLYV